MKRILLLATISILLIPSQKTFAQTYILNPYGLTSPAASLPLSKADQDLWLRSFYKIVSVLVTTDRFQIKDSQGESLDQKIKLATQSYLELNRDQAQELAQEALTLISQTAPYASMNNDLFDVLALKLMLADQHKNPDGSSFDMPDEVKPLLGQKSFLEKLPLKIQAHVRSQVPTPPVEITDLGLKTERIFLGATEIKLPTHFHFGKNLIYILNQSDLEAYWIEFRPDKEVKSEKIWSRSIWKSLTLKQLKDALESSKPKHLPTGGISVLLKEGPPILISEARWTGRQAATTSTAVAPSPKFKDPFEEAALEKAPSNSILNSPWFWMGVAAIAGGTAGYFIYDSTQTKTATSP